MIQKITLKLREMYDSGLIKIIMILENSSQILELHIANGEEEKVIDKC